MDILIITVTVFSIAFAGMAIGVILSNKVIKGSCGGIATLMGGKSACDVCAMKDRCESSGKELCEEA
ncbi:MAG: (Na+)-NQR maturation NqrM [Bdellovibrionota bacterium]|nr:(Na+)-NQR maturation NqrM [Bdellovibrionota bacterium]